MVNVNTLVKGGAKTLNIDLTDRQIEEFILYKNILKDWNQKINITSITDDEEIDIKHFIDSLTPLKVKLFKKRS